MTLIVGFLGRAGDSSPILVFQMAALATLVSAEHSTLEIIYAPTTKYLKEGQTLDLKCLIKHQKDQSLQLDAHWYKKAEKQKETEFGKEMESLHLSQNSDPDAEATSLLLLKIQKVNQSDSGHYQCRAKIKNTVLTAMGHFIRVNVTGVSIVNTTEETEGDLEHNKALRVDSELEKMLPVVVISWIIVYVKGLVP